MTREELLKNPIEHFDITAHNVVPLVDSMKNMAFTARDLNRASEIYLRMLRDEDCGIILCLAGSLISAGLKKIFSDLIRFNMIDCIVSTGANMIDQDYFEALGFRHYVADERYRSGMYDGELREMRIDRIYDTFIDEDQLRICDESCRQLFDSIEPGPYSSRQLLHLFGKQLAEKESPPTDSILLQAYRNQVPVFCPAFSDCSAGFGIVAHQHQRKAQGKPSVHFDSAADFYELTQLKIKSQQTGIIIIGGGVPKNFTQDTVVAAEILDKQVPMHKYAIQVTVADVRDGALSSSTLKEASSWGKVDTTWEQMVYSEATLAVPLIAGYAYHSTGGKGRKPRKWNTLLQD